MSDWHELERPWYKVRVKELEADLADALAKLDKERERANEAEYRLEVAIWELGHKEFE